MSDVGARNQSETKVMRIRGCTDSREMSTRDLGCSQAAQRGIRGGY